MTAIDPNATTPPPLGYDPFSYPHLYPSGWNLEDDGNNHPLQAGEDSDAEPEPGSSTLPAWYEPFHDLRTFPSGWYLP